MGSTRIDAPEVQPIDVAKQIRDTSQGLQRSNARHHCR